MGGEERERAKIATITVYRLISIMKLHLEATRASSATSALEFPPFALDVRFLFLMGLYQHLMWKFIHWGTENYGQVPPQIENPKKKKKNNSVPSLYGAQIQNA